MKPLVTVVVLACACALELEEYPTTTHVCMKVHPALNGYADTLVVRVAEESYERTYELAEQLDKDWPAGLTLAWEQERTGTVTFTAVAKIDETTFAENCVTWDAQAPPIQGGGSSYVGVCLHPPPFPTAGCGTPDDCQGVSPQGSASCSFPSD